MTPALHAVLRGAQADAAARMGVKVEGVRLHALLHPPPPPGSCLPTLLWPSSPPAPLCALPPSFPSLPLPPLPARENRVGDAGASALAKCWSTTPRSPASTSRTRMGGRAAGGRRGRTGRGGNGQTVQGGCPPCSPYDGRRNHAEAIGMLFTLIIVIILKSLQQGLLTALATQLVSS